MKYNQVKLLGKDWKAMDIRDTLDLWATARWFEWDFVVLLGFCNQDSPRLHLLYIYPRWHPRKWTCFKLDLRALKKRSGGSRLQKISFLSRIEGAIRILVHKEGQAYDENIGAEIRLADSADPRYYVLTFVDVALKVKKNIPTKHQPCDDSNYDEKLLAKATERMMLVAGFSSMAIYLTLPFFALPCDY